MTTGQLNQLIGPLNRIAVHTGDRVVLKQEELALSGASAAAFPFTGISSSDVYSIEIRVKKTGAPADTTNIARFTMVSGDTPTSTHGMYLGDGDLYTITGKSNCTNAKIIATEALAHVCNIIYYGYAG